MANNTAQVPEAPTPPVPAVTTSRALVPTPTPWTRYLAEGEGFRCSRCRALLGVREGFCFRVKRGEYELLIFGVVELGCRCGERFELNTTRWLDTSTARPMPPSSA